MHLPPTYWKLCHLHLKLIAAFVRPSKLKEIFNKPTKILEFLFFFFFSPVLGYLENEQKPFMGFWSYLTENLLKIIPHKNWNIAALKTGS